MRIAYVVRSLLERFGGPPKSSQALARILRSWGHDIEFWSMVEKRDIKEYHELSDPGQYFQVKYGREGWMYGSLFGELLELRGGRYELFHMHEFWSYPQFCSMRFARRSGIPYIVSPRGSLSWWAIHRQGMPKRVKKELFLYLFGKDALDSAACVHAVSEAEKKDIREIGYDGPVAVIPNGVYCTEFDRPEVDCLAETVWPIMRNRRVVLFLSRLSVEKGLDLLLPAWKQVVKRSGYSDALLVLAGPDHKGYGVVVKDMVSTLGIEKQVLITGMLDNDTKVAALRRADLYVLPSYSEAFSNSVLEALASGTPVIISDACNFQRAADVGAARIIKPSIVELVDALVDILDMSNEAKKSMGRCGKELVLSEYSWEHVTKKMVELYKRVISGSDVSSL